MTTGGVDSVEAASALPGAAVAVVEEDAVVLARLVGVLASVPTLQPFLHLDELLDSDIDTAEGLVLVLGPSQVYEESTLDRVSALLRTEGSFGAVLVVAEPDAATLRMALRAGLDDAVALDRTEEDLPGAVRDLRYRLQSSSSSKTTARPTTPAEHRGRVTTVFSPKGGVGKSVISVNLATALAHRSDRAVALLDLDLQFGDVAVMLRLKPAHHVGEAAAAGSRLDADLLESLLVRHERSGVYVLAAPTDTSEGAKVTSQSISEVLAVMRRTADHIIVDTAPVLDDTVLQVLSESDDIVYVVGMDVPSVKNARLGLQALELVQIPLDRILVVLNRADSRVHLATRDVERALQMKVDASLPSDALVPQSVNKGAPAVLEFDRSRFAGRMREIASLILNRASSEGEP